MRGISRYVKWKLLKWSIDLRSVNVAGSHSRELFEWYYTQISVNANSLLYTFWQLPRQMDTLLQSIFFQYQLSFDLSFIWLSSSKISFWALLFFRITTSLHSIPKYRLSWFVLSFLLKILTQDVSHVTNTPWRAKVELNRYMIRYWLICSVFIFVENV